MPMDIRALANVDRYANSDSTVPTHIVNLKDE